MRSDPPAGAGDPGPPLSRPHQRFAGDAGDHPVVLFDGPCNLCNAAVRWIIDRDPRGRFRFASLQSDAARAKLSDAKVMPGTLPDSIVLIDRGEVLTRSDAALRIARRMGFPWAMLCAFVLLPRFVRDSLYSCVARNRYRWFGRQKICMVPTPALRARFLDAGEPPRILPEAADAGSQAGPEEHPATRPRVRPLGTTSISRLAHRLLLAYLFVYILPFPLDTLVGMSGFAISLISGESAAAAAGAPTSAPASSPTPNPVIAAVEQAVNGAGQGLAGYEQGKRALVSYVAQHLFGVELKVFTNGSGDTTYNYYEAIVYVATALIIAVAWTLLARGRPVSPRTQDHFGVLVRYNLAATMLGYGWVKVWPLQMPAPGPDRLLGSLGDMSPMGIVWTLMGVSPAYQIFGGLGEVTGGLLLLFRRTSLLGALVTTGVMANVVALNYCFDIPVKLFSSHLLLQALFLIMPHAARLAALLLINLPAQPATLRPYPTRSRVRWLAAQAFKLALIAYLAVLPAFSGYDSMKVRGAYAEAKPWQGFYRVESFVRNGVADRALEDADRWVRVAFSRQSGAIQRANGLTQRYGMTFDESSHTLAVAPRPDGTATAKFKYTLSDAGVLELEGESQGQTITARLRRDDAYKPLLTTRGFNWVNEYPLNR